MYNNKIFLILVAFSVISNFSLAQNQQTFVQYSQGKQHGFLTQTYSSTGLEDCQQQCLSDPGCKIVTYTTLGECQLAPEKLYTPQDCPECQSYEKSQIHFELSNFKNKLSNTENFKTSDFLFCQQICELNSTCAAGQFDAASQACYISSKVTTENDSIPCTGCKGFIKVTNPANQIWQTYLSDQLTFLQLDTTKFDNLESKDFRYAAKVDNTVTDFNGCQNKCYSDANCQVGYYINNGPKIGECWISGSKSLNGVPVPGVISFEKKEQFTQPEFLSLGGYDYSTTINKFYEIEVADSLECQQQCQLEYECRYGFFSEGICYLSSELVVQNQTPKIPCSGICHSFIKKSYSEFFELPSYDYNLDNNRHVGPVADELECREKCLEDSNCVVGTYVKEGSRKGECWIANSQRENRVNCGAPCYSFAKSLN